MAYTYSFEKLEVWMLGRELTSHIYRLSAKWPDSEKFGLVSQIRRASVSICSNLAEGASKPSFKEKAHFTQIAYNSLMEVLNDIIIARDLEFIENIQLPVTREKIESLGNKLNAYRNYQLNQHRKSLRKSKGKPSDKQINE